MFGISKTEINDININHSNSYYFKNIKLPNNIIATNNIEKYVNDVELILIALPTNAVRTVVLSINKYLSGTVYWVNASKGLPKGIKWSHDYLDELIPVDKTKGNYKLIGGTFAIEMASKLPSKLTLTSKSSDKNDYLIETLSSDVIYIEWCDSFEIVNIFSILKNIYAILQGMIFGRGYEKNTQTFLLIDSLREISSIINDIANDETILSVDSLLKSATLGDFVLTGTSEKSRNYSFGYSIGNTGKLPDTKNITLEGFSSLEILYKTYGEDIKRYPIIGLIINIIVNKKDVETSFQEFFKNYS